MKFHNPWIDPRIVQVQPEDAKAYLRRRGWKSLGPALNPLLETFEGPAHGPETPMVLVPLAVDQGPLLQRMIDLVSDLARLEDRWAVARKHPRNCCPRTVPAHARSPNLQPVNPP